MLNGKWGQPPFMTCIFQCQEEGCDANGDRVNYTLNCNIAQTLHAEYASWRGNEERGRATKEWWLTPFTRRIEV